MSIKSDLVAKRNELKALNDKIAKIRKDTMDGAGDFDLMKSKDWPDTDDLQKRIGDMRTMKTKQDSLGVEVESLVEAVKAFDAPEGGDDPDTKGRMIHGEGGNQLVKSLGERFINSAEFKSALERGDGKARFDLKDVGLKTLMSTTAGFAPQAVRTGEIEMKPVEPVGLFALIPKGQTSQASYVYMEETTRTIAAAEKAETAAYAESAFAFTERTQAVEDVGHWIPVTRKQLDDVPQIQGLIDNEMRQGLLERLDNQSINGDGSTPNLLGILNKSGIGTRSASGQAALDALYQAMGQVQKNGMAESNLVVVNGEDWEPIQLMKSDNGQYIWGHPADIGPMRVWGRRLLPTFRIAKGTAVLGDFNRSMYAERLGVTVEITDSHSDYFIYSKLVLKCWTRGVLVWKRPLAFCKVTSLAA